jgi:dTDP-L-rhamnose 4-epimerase
MHGKAPIIFEDGEQSRDFIHVSDIVRGILLALESEAATGQAVNLGTGRQTTVARVAEVISKGLGVDIEPDIADKYRAGDIRHCFADPSRARELLGFEANVAFDDGMAGLIEWLEDQDAEDKVDAATDELAARGLAR